MDLNLRDAAKILNVSESTLSRWIKEEGLPAFLINSRYRFNRVDLLEWASHHNIPAAALYQAPEGRGVPTLASLLEGNIHYDVPGNDMKTVMTAVAERLPLANSRDKALAAQALADREAKGSTVIGDGVAIPHVRSPLIFGVDRPLLTLCFLAETVPFEPEGRSPVGVVFALVSPTIRAHLTLLANVSAALHDDAFRRLLGRRAPEAEILVHLRSRA